MADIKAEQKEAIIQIIKRLVTEKGQGATWFEVQREGTKFSIGPADLDIALFELAQEGKILEVRIGSRGETDAFRVVE